MNVGELIERLSIFKPNLPVVRGDNSGGYEAIDLPRYEKGVIEIKFVETDLALGHRHGAIVIG